MDSAIVNLAASLLSEMQRYTTRHAVAVQNCFIIKATTDIHIESMDIVSTVKIYCRSIIYLTDSIEHENMYNVL